MKILPSIPVLKLGSSLPHHFKKDAQTMSPMIKSLLDLISALDLKDVERAEDAAFHIGVVWARTRETIPSDSMAMVLVGAKADWSMAEHLAPFLIQGAEEYIAKQGQP